MANTRSDLMANVLDAGYDPNLVGADHARVRAKRCQVASVAGDAAGHLYVIGRFRATDRIVSIRIANTADAGWTDMNIGLYAGDADGQTSAGDWTAADQTLITSCQDILADGANIAAASVFPIDWLATGANGYAESLHMKELWEVAATVSARPPQGTQYDVVIQSVGNPAGGGTMVVEILYIAGD